MDGTGVSLVGRQQCFRSHWLEPGRVEGTVNSRTTVKVCEAYARSTLHLPVSALVRQPKVESVKRLRRRQW